MKELINSVANIRHDGFVALCHTLWSDILYFVCVLTLNSVYVVKHN